MQRCQVRLAFKFSQWQAGRQKVSPSLVLGLVWDWRSDVQKLCSILLPPFGCWGKKEAERSPQAINSSPKIAVDQSFSRVMWSGRTRKDPSPLPYYLIEKANKIPRKRQEEQWDSSHFSKGREVVDKAAWTTLWYSLSRGCGCTSHTLNLSRRAHIEPPGYGGAPHTWGGWGGKSHHHPWGSPPAGSKSGSHHPWDLQ